MAARGRKRIFSEVIISKVDGLLFSVVSWLARMKQLVIPQILSDTKTFPDILSSSQ